MQKSIALLLVLLLCMLCGCGENGVANPSRESQSAENPNSEAQNHEVERVSKINLTGTVTEAELKDDAYGTPYYHLSVQEEDGTVHRLVSNYMDFPFDFVQGKTYAFHVLWGAARGDLVTSVEETEQALGAV